MPPLHTERLIIEEITLAAAPFVIELLNDPEFIRHIADRGVRTVEDAERFLAEGPLHSYREHGFGMYLVRERDSGEPVGMCGLVKREALPDIDIGYAFLRQARGRGLALEAAQRVMRYALEELHLTCLLARKSVFTAGRSPEHAVSWNCHHTDLLSCPSCTAGQE